MGLREEWDYLLEKKQDIYIYGAGTIGRKILDLVQKAGKFDKLKGILVSDISTQDADYLGGIPIIQINNIEDKEIAIFVSVSDIYQNEIMEHLQNLGFVNVVCAYKYSFLDEKETLQEMPDSVLIDLRELLVQQYKDYKFNRFDIIVRLLAVEDHYKKNDYGFELYEKMQNVRIRDGYALTATKRFKDLINSVEKYGYDTDSEIIVDRNLKLIDGSHRIALAIYHKVEKIRIRILDKFTDYYYGIDWFRDCFDDQECKELSDYEGRLFQEFYCPIKGIIWPAASCCWQEITELINSQYEVTNIVDYEFPTEIFERFVHGVYQIDDIAEWKINAKLKHFGDRQTYTVRLFDINMKYPDFRIKRAGGTLSRNGEKLKKLVREKYQDKVENYFYDIVFHAADNYCQSEYIDRLVKKVFSLQELLGQLDDLEWMLIKTENDYFPKDFPVSYPAYKDIDMICKRRDAGVFMDRIVSFFGRHEKGQYETKVISEEGKGFRVRLELCGFLIFQVDVSYSSDILCEQFIEESLSRRVAKDGYYICDKKDEILYRMADLYRHPKKEKHITYIKNNIENLVRWEGIAGNERVGKNYKRNL